MPFFFHLSGKCIFKHLFRFFLLVNLVCANVGYSVFTSSFFANFEDFKSYFFVSWFANSLLVVPSPVFLLSYIPFFKELFNQKDVHEKNRKEMSYVKLWVICLILAPFQLLSSYFWFISMEKIPVSLNVSCYQSLNIVIFFGSVIFLWKRTRQHLLLKLLCLLACVSGVVLLTTVGGYGNSDQRFSPSEYVLGVLLTVLSASLLGVFSVVYEILCGNLDFFKSILCLSFCGLNVLILYLLGIPLLQLLGLECPFTWQPNIISSLVCIGFLQIYFCFSNLLLVAFSNALYTGICMASSIGVSVLIDFFVFHVEYNAMTYVSIGILFLSSIGINIAEVLPPKWDPMKCWVEGNRSTCLNIN